MHEVPLRREILCSGQPQDSWFGCLSVNQKQRSGPSSPFPYLQTALWLCIESPMWLSPLLAIVAGHGKSSLFPVYSLQRKPCTGQRSKFVSSCYLVEPCNGALRVIVMASRSFEEHCDEFTMVSIKTSVPDSFTSHSLCLLFHVRLLRLVVAAANSGSLSTELRRILLSNHLSTS